MRARLVVMVVLAAGCGRIDFDPPGGGSGGGAATLAIASGYGFSCTARSDGTVWCWGIANGAPATPSPRPVQVPGLAGAVAVTAANGHACALDGDGTVRCWGDGGDYQLGNGIAAGVTSPVIAALPMRAISISAGGAHTCAVLEDHTAWCWGSNSTGESMPGLSGDVMQPTQVATGVSTVSAGLAHTCALGDDGGVTCWGVQAYGALGDGASDGAITTGTVIDSGGALVATAIGSGTNHTCAIVAGGAYACWGSDSEGQLGGGTDLSAIALPPSSLTGIVQIAAGDLDTCAVLASGDLYCWGDNTYGQVGDNSQYEQTSPQRIDAGGPIAQVAPGYDHTCALRRDGSIACWGRGSTGQLGDGTLAALSPVKVTMPAGTGTVTDLSAGDEHACAIAGGNLYCWGNNTNEQVGDFGPDLDVATPSLVPGVPNPALLALGHSHSCANSNGSLYCWGSNYHGALGLGTETFAEMPTKVPYLPSTSVTAVSASLWSTCVVSDVALCWGWGYYGQQGQGANGTDNDTQAFVNLVNPVTDITLGDDHACATTTAGVVCWGGDQYGETGIGSPMFATTPMPIAGSWTFSEINAGSHHTCAIQGGTQLVCWGLDDHGQLGDGSTDELDQPTVTSTFVAISSIRAGGDTTCALIDSGGGATWRCWGDNTFGQVGDGTGITRLQPTTVNGPTFTQVTTGGSFVCGVDTAGAIWCWGDNAHGQLGNGTFSRSLVAVDVAFP